MSHATVNLILTVSYLLALPIIKLFELVFDLFLGPVDKGEAE